MNLKIPPPIVALTFVFFMWIISIIGDAMSFESLLLLPAAIFLFSIGIVTALLGVYSFKKARTTLNPIKINDASQLVSTGIY